MAGRCRTSVSLPHISVAGNCSAGTRLGSGDAHRCLAAAAVAVEFARGDGELDASPATTPHSPAPVLALGALGVFTRVTFAIQPSHDLRQDVWLDAPLDTVTERCGEIMAAGYSVSMFTTWSRSEVIDQVWVKSRAGCPVVDGRARGARAAHAPHNRSSGRTRPRPPGNWRARPLERATPSPSSSPESTTTR